MKATKKQSETYTQNRIVTEFVKKENEKGNTVEPRTYERKFNALLEILGLTKEELKKDGIYPFRKEDVDFIETLLLNTLKKGTLISKLLSNSGNNIEFDDIDQFMKELLLLQDNSNNCERLVVQADIAFNYSLNCYFFDIMNVVLAIMEDIKKVYPYENQLEIMNKLYHKVVCAHSNNVKKDIKKKLMDAVQMRDSIDDENIIEDFDNLFKDDKIYKPLISNLDDIINSFPKIKQELDQNLTQDELEDEEILQKLLEDMSLKNRQEEEFENRLKKALESRRIIDEKTLKQDKFLKLWFKKTYPIIKKIEEKMQSKK